MKDRPLVSVIMPAYNVERYVGETVRSVLDQDMADFELLVRDDGSEDGTADVVAAFDDPRVILSPERDHRGGAASRNALLAMARGDYMAVMDSDDIAAPNWLGTLAGFLDRNPSVGVVGGDLVVCDQDGRPLSVKRRFRSNRTLQQLYTHTMGVAHPGALVRRSCVEIVGPYRECIPASFDYDLFSRLAEACDHATVPVPLIGYRQHAGQISTAKRDVQTKWRMRIRQAVRDRRATGHDDLGGSDQDERIGAFAGACRPPEELARQYRLWAMGFSSRACRDWPAAKECLRKADELAPARGVQRLEMLASRLKGHCGVLRWASGCVADQVRYRLSSLSHRASDRKIISAWAQWYEAWNGSPEGGTANP